MALSPYFACKMGGSSERSKEQGGGAFEANCAFSQTYNQFLSGGLCEAKGAVEGRYLQTPLFDYLSHFVRYSAQRLEEK